MSSQNSDYNREIFINLLLQDESMLPDKDWLRESDKASIKYDQIFLGNNYYHVELMGDRVICEVVQERMGGYKGTNFLVGEATADSLKKYLSTGKLMGTLERYKNFEVPNPDWHSEMPIINKTKIERRKIGEPKTDVELPPEMAAIMTMIVLNEEGMLTKTTDEYLDKIISEK